MKRIIFILIFSLLILDISSKHVEAVAETELIPQVVVPYFAASAPLKVITQITNNGSFPQTPQGFLLVFDLFGNLTSQTKLEETAVNPLSTKTYENFVGGLYFPGPYKLIFSGFYGTEDQKISRTVSFWYFPYKTLIPLFLVIGILILLIVNWEKKIVLKQKTLEKKLDKEEEEIKKLKEKLKNI